MAARTNKLYNYLVNTYGLSKEIVMTYARERMDELIDKNVKEQLLNSNHVQHVILNAVADIVKNGTKSDSWSRRTAFEDYVKSCVREEIKKRLNAEYQLEVKLVGKEDGTIGHSPPKTADLIIRSGLTEMEKK